MESKHINLVKTNEPTLVMISVIGRKQEIYTAFPIKVSQ